MDRAEQLLERIAVGIEKLADDPVLQVESGPPVCPHCEFLNPEIEVVESSGLGPFSTFCLEPKCGNCGNDFYAVPVEWATFTTYQDAEAELQRRREVFEGVSDE